MALLAGLSDNRNGRFYPGFTIVELLIVISIIFILGALSSAFYSRFFLQNTLQATNDQIIEELHTAQMFSIQGQNNSAWGVKYLPGKLVMFSGSDYVSRNSNLDRFYDLNSGVNVNGFNEIIFSKIYGFPSASSTITLSANNNSKIIMVNEFGVVDSF